ncbi:MAG: hypothetical protein WCK02_16140 [Bacteroidota bacterium]
MTISTEDILKIKELAGLFFHYNEIATLMEKDEVFLIQLKNPNSEANQAYVAGKVSSEYNLRRKTLERALKGSPAAEDLMLKHLTTLTINENK